MGKAKQRRILSQNPNPYARGRRHEKPTKPNSIRATTSQRQNYHIPFKSTDHILLVGEGRQSSIPYIAFHALPLSSTRILVDAYD